MLADPLMPLPHESSQLEGESAPRGGVSIHPRQEVRRVERAPHAELWRVRRTTLLIHSMPSTVPDSWTAAMPRHDTRVVLANINWHLRWFIGDLLMEQNRPKDARPYFASLQFTPLAQYRLGEIYEQLGEPEKARAAFAFFLEAWSRADPELQPMVVTARAAVHRLAGLRRQ